MKMHKGFTLIELIVVIVILGILAVSAAPKFIDLQKDARTAALRGMKGTVNSAIQMLRAKALVQGVTTGAVCIESSCSENRSSITENNFRNYPNYIWIQNGYPYGNTAYLGVGKMLNLECYDHYCEDQDWILVTHNGPTGALCLGLKSSYATYDDLKSACTLTSSGSKDDDSNPNTCFIEIWAQTQGQFSLGVHSGGC